MSGGHADGVSGEGICGTRQEGVVHGLIDRRCDLPDRCRTKYAAMKSALAKRAPLKRALCLWLPDWPVQRLREPA